jgi:hypothetical protein
VADLNFKQLRQDAMTVITGLFVASIVEATVVTNSKGNPMIKTKWKIQSGPYAGRPLYNNFNITVDSPAALKMFFGQMSILGMDAAYFDRLPSGDAGVNQIARDMIGKTAELKVGSRMWNGTEQENIEEIRAAPAGFGGSGPATGGVLPQALPAQTSSTPVAVATTPAAVPSATPASVTSAPAEPVTVSPASPSSPPPSDPF